ncbi:MAG: type II secretion system F family protein [Thiobacillus sp.]|nr:type II secretion system F family protein [Thiobacillus sp.]
MDAPWIIPALALAAGLAAALAAWLLARLAADVPAQDRSWLDPPPWGFRLLWWPIQWLAHYLDGNLPAAWLARQDTRLRLGGLDYALNGAQFAAARLLWGLLCALACLGLAGLFGRAGPLAAGFGFLFGFAVPAVWLGDRIEARRRQTFKALPFMLDLITLCVEGGLNFDGALRQAVDKGPTGALRDEFSRLLRDLRAGKPRAEALRDLSGRMDLPAVSHFVGTLIQAEATGMSLGPILRAQAEQRRTERFARAEKLAMEAPVKLLFPLLAFIFPAVFLILLFPIVVKIMASGF